jgi:hypothetical protein
MPDGRQYRCKACRSLYDQWRRAPHATISRLLVLWKSPVVMVNTMREPYREAQAG